MSEMLKEETIKTVLRLLEEKRPVEISRMFKTMLPADIAEVIDNEEIDEKQRTLLFRLLPKDE